MNDSNLNKQFEIKAGIIRCVIVARIIKHLCCKLQTTLVFLDNTLDSKTRKLCKTQNIILDSAGNLMYQLENLLLRQAKKTNDIKFICYARQVNRLYQEVVLSDVDSEVDNLVGKADLKNEDEYYKLKIGNIYG